MLYVAVYLSGFASLLILRRREPDLPRPYKAWWYPWSTVLVLLASGAFLLGSVIGDLKHSLFTAILILLSYVASILIVREKGPPTRLTISRSPSSFNEFPRAGFRNCCLTVAIALTMLDQRTWWMSAIRKLNGRFGVGPVAPKGGFLVASCLIVLIQAGATLGLVRIRLEQHENHYAGDGNVEPNGECEACDSAVHRETARQREKERGQHHWQSDDGKDYVAG